MDPVAVFTRLARDLAAPSSPLLARALAAIVSDGALSEAMAARVLDLTAARYTPDALASLRSDRFADRAVRVVLASSVAVAPLRAVALPLLYGARSLRVKPSSRQPRFASLLVDALATHDVNVVLDDGAPADVVVAYGSDETLTATRDALPAGVVFYGYGHGYGASVVTAPSDEAARAVALDVALHDQRGCLSPQSVLVVGDARAFALSVHRALGELDRALPRGPMEVGDAARALRWMGEQAAMADALHRGEGHAVSVWSEARLVPSPGARHVAVAGTHDVDVVRDALAVHARYLSVVGVAGDARSVTWPEGFRGRVVEAGTMQDPPLDGPEDARPPMREREG